MPEDTLIGKISVAGEVIYVGGGEPYSGSYTITPTTTSQTLQTRNKTMSDNLSVLSIPYAEVSNVSGKTVIIGG